MVREKEGGSGSVSGLPSSGVNPPLVHPRAGRFRFPPGCQLTTTTVAGLEILIRPVRPRDARLLLGLFHAMSPQSVYFRFLSTLKTLDRETVRWMTRVDYEKDVGLVALQRRPKSPGCMVGVCHLLEIPKSPCAEFSIMVGDPWHRKGVGSKLLERCIAIARIRGIKTIWGLVSAENSNMLALARKMGMVEKRTLGSDEYEVRIDIDDNRAGIT